MDRGIGDTQLSGYLCDRLATGLRQLHRLLFEFSRIDFLNLCHADPSPNLLEYISALGTLPNRGKVMPHCICLVEWTLHVKYWCSPRGSSLKETFAPNTCFCSPTPKGFFLVSQPAF